VPLGRTLTTLNLYDLLANLIPGIALTIVLIVLFPVDWFGLSPSASSGTFVAAVLVFGFISGHIIQWLGSRLDRHLQKRNHDGEDLFSRTLEGIENEDERLPIGARTEVEDSFVNLAKTQFDLSDDFPESTKLLLLVLSYLETQPATRALRFQTIHTFHRSMWSASILSLLATPIAGISVCLGWVTTTPQALLVIFFGSLVSIYVFNNRKNKFEKTFLRYVFLDFYQNQVKERS
jgi:hypothetical protein